MKNTSKKNPPFSKPSPSPGREDGSAAEHPAAIGVKSTPGSGRKGVDTAAYSASVPP